jgi:hypothetical protein
MVISALVRRLPADLLTRVAFSAGRWTTLQPSRE